MRFQGLFHSPRRGAFHPSLTVLVRYRSHGSLQPWRVVPPASRPVSRAGRYSGTPLRRPASAAYRALTVFGAPSQGTSATAARRVRGSYNPAGARPRGLGSARFARRYSGPLVLISPPPGTEMFQFPGFASLRRVIPGIAPRWVPPFGHLGITACVRLPRAFRSLPRPSSPSCAQASPTRPRSLDHTLLVYRPSRARAIYDDADDHGESQRLNE